MVKKPNERIMEQADGLRSVLHDAVQRFPTYRAHLEPHGLNETIVNLTDRQVLERFEKVPATDTRLYSSTDKQALNTIDKDLWFLATTSGSTSSPKVRYGTQEDGLSMTRRTARALQMAGLTPKDHILCYDFYTMDLYLDFLNASTQLGIYNCDYASAQRDFDKGMEESLKTEPNVLITVPSLLCRSIDGFLAAQEKGSGVEKIIYWGEKFPQQTKNMLEEEYGIELYSLYGSTEVGWVSMECSAHDGLHMFAEDVLPSAVRTRKMTYNRFSSANAKEIELAVTNLTLQGKPAIKYKVGDWVQVTEDPCSCGSHLPRMHFVERESESISIFGAKVSYDEIHSAIFENGRAKYDKHMQVVLNNVEDVTHLTVRLPEQLKQYHDDVIEAIRDQGDFADLEYHGTLSLHVDYVSTNIDSRKAKRILDNR